MTALVLESERLRLRPFAPDDVDALHAQWTAPEVRRYLWDGRVIERDEVVAVVEESVAAFTDGRLGFWVIEERGRVVGFTGFRPMPDSTDIELYYGLDRSHWGCGLATEASRAALRHAFETVGIDPIWIRTDGPNLASVEVMKRLGATYVRTDPIGAFGSTIVYVLRRADFSG